MCVCARVRRPLSLCGRAQQPASVFLLLRPPPATPGTRAGARLRHLFAVAVDGRPIAAGEATSTEMGVARVRLGLALPPGSHRVVTVTALGAGTAVAVLGLAVQAGGGSPARRGARLPHVRYEAEDAGRCTGKVLGPDYAAYADEVHLGTEASQRMACQLQPSAPQRVALALTSPANALRIRYSIPDAASGGGTRARLTVAVARPGPGTDVETVVVTLTSEYSWYYGSYPFSNDPSAGKGHHYYDEAYVTLNATAPVGSVVTLAPTPAVTTTPTPTSTTIPAHTTAGQHATAPAPPSAECSRVPVPARHDCGFNGINKTQCVAGRGCCWVPNAPPNPTHVPDCFHPGGRPPSPPPPPPPPSPPRPFSTEPITIDNVLAYVVQVGVRPTNSLSLVDHGGDPTGHADSAGAFDAACRASVARGDGAVVWIPPGVFQMDRPVCPEPFNDS